MAAFRWPIWIGCSDRPHDVIAVGPGLGTAPSTVRFVHALVERAGVPLVLDADALNAFAEEPDRLAGAEGRDVIITPHPGEFARLTGVTTADVQANRLELARNFAASHRVYVVLKGHRTIIATPDERVFINPTGNAGHGERRDGRRAHRHRRRLARTPARRRGRLQARRVPARHRRETWPRRRKGKWRSPRRTSSRTWATRCWSSPRGSALLVRRHRRQAILSSRGDLQGGVAQAWLRHEALDVLDLDRARTPTGSRSLCR